MVAILSSLVLLLASPCLILVGIWVYHLRTATKLGNALSTIGASAASAGSLAKLGPCEECRFSTADGVTLRGTYVHHRAQRRRGVLVFCHQFGGDRHVAARYVPRLLDEGFDVFAFDFRNQGMSERMAGYTPRAWPTRLEVLDVLAALEYLAARDDADPKGVALMGLSRGGGTAISAARGNPRVWAIVTDGAFVSQWMAAANVRRFMPHVVRLAPALRWVPGFLYDFYGVVVLKLVARKAKHACTNLAGDVRGVRQPLFMVHGKHDRTVPVELAYRLWRRAAGRTRLWIVPHGGHNSSICGDPAGYQRRICRFLKQHAGAPADRGTERPAAASRGEEGHPCLILPSARMSTSAEDQGPLCRGEAA